MQFLLTLLLPFLALAYPDEGAPPAERITAYKPTYGIVGKYDGKIQLSFKARPANGLPLYFGYTQLMMWDIYKSSAPMRDINFNPEVFYRLTLGDPKSLRWLDLGPFEHESNGVDGNKSRSWNRTYARYSDADQIGERLLQWSVKLYAPYSCEISCARYRGIAEGMVSLNNLFSAQIGENDVILRVYPGGKGYVNFGQGGQELTFRIRPGHSPIMPLFVVQLFRGFGENLLDQSREGIALRGGIGF
jgi:outer membrane phospholipase A